MARLTDPEILTEFQHVLSQWQFTGYITWKPIARQWLEQNLDPTVYVVSIHDA